MQSDFALVFLDSYVEYLVEHVWLVSHRVEPPIDKADVLVSTEHYVVRRYLLSFMFSYAYGHLLSHVCFDELGEVGHRDVMVVLVE